MQAGDNEILNQEKVDTVGNKDGWDVEPLGSKKKTLQGLGDEGRRG